MLVAVAVLEEEVEEEKEAAAVLTCFNNFVSNSFMACRQFECPMSIRGLVFFFNTIGNVYLSAAVAVAVVFRWNALWVVELVAEGLVAMERLGVGPLLLLLLLLLLLFAN